MSSTESHIRLEDSWADGGSNPPTLNVVGAGQVARLLARCWLEAGIFELGGLVTRRLQTARAARDFAGAGRPETSLQNLGPARFWMIGTPDDEISTAAANLAKTGLVNATDVVFHLSGALDSSSLMALEPARCASLHLLKTVPDAATAYRSMESPTFAVEGDEDAVDALARVCKKIGGRVVPLQRAAKTLYHAANVMACNYLTVLLDMGLRLYGRAGIPSDRALEMIGDLMNETLANGLASGPGQSLTGPVRRGDVSVVQRHLEHLDGGAREVYRVLGRAAVDLAESGGHLDADVVQRLKKALA